MFGCYLDYFAYVQLYYHSFNTNMKLALLFPQFAPNLYDLAAMLQADRVIVQDNEKWSRKSRVHRAQIRTNQGTQWVNIPVMTEDRRKPINEVRIGHHQEWIEPLLRSLRLNYNKSIYFDFYEPDIENAFAAAAQFEYLLPFVLHLQYCFFSLLHLSVDYTLASGMSNYTSNPDKLAERLNANILFQEYDSRHYQHQAHCKNEPNFIHPKYYQHFGGFEPGCCLLDLLFQMGPESFKIIETLKKD